MVPARSHSLVLGIGLLLAGALVLAALFVPSSVDMEQMQASTVRIVCKTKEGIWSGSGFVIAIGPVTRIVTSDHVAACARSDGAQSLGAVVSRSEMVPLKVEWRDADKDLAIVGSTLTLNRPAARLADTSSVVSGAPVTVIGFPSAADQMADAPNIAVPSVSRGNVSRIISGTHGTRYLQHTAPTNPGNSGGPVYDQAGNVIGVNSMKALTLVPTISGGHLAAGRVASGEGIAVAVDVAEILSALEQLQVPYAMIGNYSDMSMPMTLVAATVAMILAAAGIVVLTSSGRDWVFRRTIPIKIRDPNARGGKIRVINGALAGTELSISAKVILGRDPTQAQMVFPQDDTAVSRRHCEIGFNTGVGQFEVRDLKSRNGTFIAGDAGPPRRLAPEVVERVAPGHSVLVGSSRNRLALELI